VYAWFAKDTQLSIFIILVVSVPFPSDRPLSSPATSISFRFTIYIRILVATLNQLVLASGCMEFGAALVGQLAFGLIGLSQDVSRCCR
jgi:hypothetical protein